MDSTTLIGLFGGTLTTIAFFPQLIKTWKTRSARDFSLWMLILLTIGVLIWGIYGLLIGSFPLILTNTITFILSLIILMFKIRYK
ncbi:MAG: hypothetical protein A2Y48_09160 [Nitrospirae bacterium RIFCSPLOW2_12_42_9]|nr:MAG: hypothetical protein A2Y48_09160 [Nitrospirae bacterium RIFCSPLOW2_12_42_9]